MKFCDDVRSATVRHLFLGSLLISMLVWSGCGSSAGATTPALANIAWCAAPTIAFGDEGVSPSTTITEWKTAQPALHLSPLLPPTLPAGSCLVSVGGIVHDPTFGTRFIITYALPNHGALSIAETPQSSEIAQPQCTTSDLGTTPLTTCQQTRTGLNVTLSSTLPEHDLRALLGTLKTGVKWLPIKA